MNLTNGNLQVGVLLSDMTSGGDGLCGPDSVPPPIELDPDANRAEKKYSAREQIGRVLWSVGKWAFRLSPRPLFGWRRWVLRRFGARVGMHVHVYPTTRIYMPWNLQIDDWAAIGEDAFVYNLAMVRIGRAAAVSYRAHICAGSHDFNLASRPLLKLPVTIGNGAWIGTDAFVGPNVVVGENAIVGARAVVVKSVPPGHVVVGNPARTVRIRASQTA